MIPEPCLFTILLAMKPAIRPRTIHAMIDMSNLLTLVDVGPDDLGRSAAER